MEWYVLLPLALLLLVVLLLTGMPIFVGFFVLNVVGVLVFIGPSGFGLLVNSIYETGTSTLLTAIPLFIVMGEVLFRSGSVDVLFDAIGTLIGRIRGRLYYFTIALSTIFGALSGSAIASTAMLGKTALPVMERRGYDTRLSIGVILAGSSLAPIIPPSTLAVVIGSIADVSIAKLLIAGILPGIVLAMLFAGFVAIKVHLNPATVPEERDHQSISIGRRVVGLLNCLPFSLVIFGVMGLILLGVATPSESAATGVLASLLTAAYYRKLTFALIIDAVKSAAAITSMILALLVSSTLFTQLLAFTGATKGLVEAVASLQIGELAIVAAAMAVTFVMCMFIDQIAYMLLAIPIFEPLLESFDIDPVWFWTLFLVNLSLGSLTPPFGYNLFTMKGVAPWIEMGQIFSAAWMVVWVVVLGLVIFMLWPALITVVPAYV